MPGSPGMPFEVACFSVQLSALCLRQRGYPTWGPLLLLGKEVSITKFYISVTSTLYRYLPVSHPLQVGKISGAGKIRKSRMRGQNSEENQIMRVEGEGRSRKHKNGWKKGKAEKNSKRKKLHAINYNCSVLMFHYCLSKQELTYADTLYRD